MKQPADQIQRIQTSVRLHPEMWAALTDLATRKTIAEGKRVTLHDLLIEGARHVLAADVAQTERKAEDDPIARYAMKGGPTPRVGVIRDSFWAGYKGETNRLHGGVPRSVQRKAFQAGVMRAKAEPGLKVSRT